MRFTLTEHYNCIYKDKEYVRFGEFCWLERYPNSLEYVGSDLEIELEQEFKRGELVPHLY